MTRRQDRSEASLRARREELDARPQYEIGTPLVADYMGKPVQGFVTSIVGTDIRLEHPNGHNYTVQADDVLHVAKRIYWPGVADNAARLGPDVLRKLEMANELLSLCSERQADDLKRSIIRPLEYAIKTMYRQTTYVVVVPDGVEPPEDFEEAAALFPVEVVCPLQRPQPGFNWFVNQKGKTLDVYSIWNVVRPDSAHDEVPADSNEPQDEE